MHQCKRAMAQIHKNPFNILSLKWNESTPRSTHSFTHSLICPHNALVSHLNLVPGFRHCFFLIDYKRAAQPFCIYNIIHTYMYCIICPGQSVPISRNSQTALNVHIWWLWNLRCRLLIQNSIIPINV